MPARGIRGPPPRAHAQHAVAYEGTALAELAEAEALQAEHHGGREIVVDTQALDRVLPEAGAVIHAAAGGESRVPEIIRRRAAVVERVLPRVAGKQHGRPLQVARTLGRGHDPGHRAVVDQAVVQQMQRLADRARTCVVGQRDRAAMHHRIRVQAGMVAERHRDVAQVSMRRAELVHVPAPHHGMHGAGAGHAPGAPLAVVAAIQHAHGTAVVAVDQRHRLRRTAVDRLCGQRQRHAAEASRRFRQQAVLRVDPHDLGEALVAGDAADDQPIDVRWREAAIVQRQVQRLAAQAIAVGFREVAEARGADAGKGDLVAHFPGRDDRRCAGRGDRGGHAASSMIRG